MSKLSNTSRARFAKAVTVLTSVTTVLSMSGVMYFAPVASAAAPSDYGLKEGWTISAAGSSDPDIYIVNDAGYKRLFLNPVIFNFYGHLGGFAAVHNISAATRDAFPTSGLFRNCETNDQKVYGVETTGEDTGMLHWVNTSGAQAVADDPNFFAKVFCINNNEFNWYSKGSDYTSVSQVPNYSRSGNVVTAGPVSVGLASTNPVAGTIVDGQARYDLAEFMFSGNATVTSVKLQRVGVSADASLTNVYLYDGVKRLTDSATVSSGVISFNDASGLFNVSGSKVISVLADVDGTSGETVGVKLTEVNGNAVSVSGNLHTIATATLATVTMANTTTPSTDAAPVPVNDSVAWQNVVTVGNRYVWLKSIQYRVVGSVQTGDLQNFRLYVDGVMKGSAVAQQDSNGYITFDLSGSPVKLETGSRTIKVLVDIINGSGRDFYLSLRQKSDIWATDSDYGAAILAAVGTDTFPIDSNKQTIAAGTITFTKRNDSPSGDVVKGASNVPLARWDVKAAGEKMKVENLRFELDSSTITLDALRNGAVYLDGVQVGSTKTLWENSISGTASNSLGLAYTEYTFGSSFIVTPGTPRVMEFRADIFDNSGTNQAVANNTFHVDIADGSSNVQRLTKLDYISCLDNDSTSGCTATAAADGNGLTIKTGSFSAGKYTGYANQTIVVPKNGVKLGHFTLTSASSEDVQVNTITIDDGNTSGDDFDAADLTDVYIKVWNDAGSVIYTSPTKSTISATASNSYSTNFTMPKNKTYQVEVWGNVGSTDVTATDTVGLTLDASGVTTGSSTTATADKVAGQTLTAQTGSLTVANGSLPAAQFRAGGTTATGYQFTLTPTYDDFTLDEVYVDLVNSGATLLASTSGAVANLSLKDGSTVLGTAVINSSTSSASFTGLNLPLTQSGGTKTLTVDVTFANVGVGANDTAGSVTVRLDGLKYRNSAGTYNVASDNTLNGLAVSTHTGNASSLVKGYPTFTNTALPTTALNAGVMTLFKTVVSATGGQIAWNLINFQVASSSGTIDIDDSTYKLYENGVDITDSATRTVASASQTSNYDHIKFTFATERVVSAGGSVTLELRGTVGAAASTNTITTQLPATNGTTVTSKNSADSATTGTIPSFVWSDQSAPSHSTTTSDWFTDGLLKTIADSQTVSK